MFSKDITGSDAFLEMPASSQALYFHFGMEADDDGFIGNPKKIMRVMGVSEDDMKILLAKRFLLAFKSGIIVVKHHRINNNWDAHNCKRTIYLEEFSELRIKENRAYTLDETQGVPVQSDSRLNPVFRIDKNRIDKSTSAVATAPRVLVKESTGSRFGGEDSHEEKAPRSVTKYPHAKEVFAWFPRPQKSWESLKNVQEREYAEFLYARGEDAVKKMLRYVNEWEGNEDFKYVVTKPSDLEKKWEDLRKYGKRNS